VAEPSPGTQLKSSITDATRKIESIIDDAERAAAEIRAEARAEAERESRRLISESAARLAAVVDPLHKRVENLRVEAAALMHELEAATLKLAELTTNALEQESTGAPLAAESPVTDSPEPPALVEDVEPPSSAGPVPVAYPGKSTAPTAAADPPEEAMLRATQMAVAGNSRSEIEATLKEDFGLDDPTTVVDDILGPA
jgi:uncharacterized membrane protein YccC